MSPAVLRNVRLVVGLVWIVLILGTCSYCLWDESGRALERERQAAEPAGLTNRSLPTDYALFFDGADLNSDGILTCDELGAVHRMADTTSHPTEVRIMVSVFRTALREKGIPCP